MHSKNIRFDKTLAVSKLKKFISGKWLFPAFLTVLLLIFTLLGIHGSSIGVYDTLLNEKGGNLIIGEPRTTRSDEWVTNTPLTFSQVKNDFPVINQDIGLGQDMTVVVDVPYKEWSVLFKPQNLSFFVMPLVNAFAFKWWLLLYVLMLAVYFFILTLAPKKYLLAGLLAVFFAASPFIQWWYQSITVLPIAYMLIAVTLAVDLVRAKTRNKRLLLSGLLSYVVACFALIMYPPFQIPCAIIGIVLFLAIYLGKYKWSHIFKNKTYLYILSSLVLAGIVVAAFLLQHREAVQATLHTVYPGARSVAPGGEDLQSFTNWPFSYLLQSNEKQQMFGSNASEVSRFHFFGLLTLPFLIFEYVYARRNKIASSRLLNALLAGMLAVFALFSLRTFVPFGDPFYKLIGLGSIPHSRLIIGFGIINLILLAVTLLRPNIFRSKKYFNRYIVIYAGISTLLISTLILYTTKVNDLVSVGNKELAVIIFICSVGLVLLLHNRHSIRIAGLILITLYSISSSFYVHPIYRGTSALANSSLAREVGDREASNDSRWIVDDYWAIENITLAAGAESLGVIYSYPQIKLWERYFPNDENIYNRFAHVNFTIDDSADSNKIELRNGDLFSITTSSCSEILNDLKVDYIISSHKTDNYGCFSPAKPVSDGAFIIYVRDT